MAIDPEVLAELERELERVRQDELRRQKPAPTETIDRRRMPYLPMRPDIIRIDESDQFTDWESWWLTPTVRAWVEAQAVAHSVPIAIPLATAWGNIAAALQGKVEVEIKPGWREPLSIYWIVASPTGTLKSKVLDAAKAPLKAIEAAGRELAEEQAKLNRKTRNMLEGRCKKLRSMFATKGSLSTDQKNELDSSEASLDRLPNQLAPIIFVANVNPALIPRIMAHNYEAEGIARFAVLGDEDTFLSNMMGRHSGHADLEAVLSGYTGGAIEMARKSVMTDDIVHTQISHAHMTLVVLTQPHVVDQLRHHHVLGDQGFWGRTIVTVVPRGELTSSDAPPVPDAVQAAYAELIKRLHALPGGQVIRAPEGAWGQDGALRKMYDRIRTDVANGGGGEGYAVRTVGRVCRFWAIAEACRTVELSNESNCPEGAGGLREVFVLDYLFNALYLQVLSQSRALQPASAPAATTPHRVLAWLRQSTHSTVGSHVTLRRLMNALKLRKDVLEEALDSLVEHGYLSPGPSTRNRNGTTTLTYIVMGLEATDSGTEASARADLEVRMKRARMTLVPPDPDEPPF